MGKVVQASPEKGKDVRLQAEAVWSLLSSCQAHQLSELRAGCSAQPVLPAGAGCPGPSCAKAPCVRSCFPAGTDSWGDEKSCISTSSLPCTSSSHLAAHVPRTACSHVLTALVPKNGGDGGSLCHGNHHRGTQHLHSPGNVPSPVQTGLENSRVLAGKKQKCCLLRGSPRVTQGELPGCRGCAVILYPPATPQGERQRQDLYPPLHWA